MKTMMMRITIVLICLAVNAANAAISEEDLRKMIPTIFAEAQVQYRGMLKQMEAYPGLLPRTVDKGKFSAVKPDDWTSGFFPGSLWYLYEYTKAEEWKVAAKDYTARLEKIRHYTGNHDVGFMLYCSYGNGLRLADVPGYKEVLLDGAKALSTRYNEKLGLIRSWDSYTFPVIIDNMMNLELLMWAARNSGGVQCEVISRSHADVTLKNHYRPDGSAYHIVDYNPETGKIIDRYAGQGKSKEGPWARGQSWGLYGFTMMYRETKDKRYLDRATSVADFLLSHKNLPADGIPYWDYEAPGTPETWRDASAAAIMASALLELSGYVEDAKAKRYRAMAIKQLCSLSSPAYRAAPNSNGCFLLMHSVGNLPKNYEIDVPLNYADYYYLEALLRVWK
jgi:unsaturated chondroitin disaccharide hydrolase